MLRLILFFLLTIPAINLKAEDGYRVWLRFEKISDKPLLKNYRDAISRLQINPLSATLKAAREELTSAL